MLTLLLQNRFYIETKLKTDLNVELRKLFVRHVAEKHVPILIRKSVLSSCSKRSREMCPF